MLIREDETFQVEYIEQQTVPVKFEFVEQAGAIQALVRLSQRDKADSAPYVYDDSAGEGTCVYVVDTGIDTDHPVSKPSCRV